MMLDLRWLVMVVVTFPESVLYERIIDYCSLDRAARGPWNISNISTFLAHSDIYRILMYFCEFDRLSVNPHPDLIIFLCS